MADRHVVTAFLHRAGHVLLLRRSGEVSTFRGRWAAVSGGLERGVAPIDQALREIREETGLEAAQLSFECAGAALVAEGHGWRFIVHPFRFRMGVEADPRLDWEHSEQVWADPEDIDDATSVPRLRETWRRVAPEAIRRPSILRRVRELETDRRRGASALAAEGVALLGDAALALAAQGSAPGELRGLAAAVARVRPCMVAIGNLAADWASRLPGPGSPELGREARGASVQLITEQREALETAARCAAEALRTARTIASGSYSSSVVATCAAPTERRTVLCSASMVLSAPLNSSQGIETGGYLFRKKGRSCK